MTEYCERYAKKEDEAISESDEFDSDGEDISEEDSESCDDEIAGTADL